MKYDIFLSYRRKGGYTTAKHLYDLLTKDGYKVSFDLDTLRNGDFDTQLLTRIDECKDFIIVLNKGAFDRCFDPTVDKNNDWLRNELAYALEKNKNIIPIMLEDFSFPNNLPEDIAKISMKNTPKYSQEYFDDFYRKLKTEFLLTKKKSNSWKYILGVCCVLIILFGAYFFTKNNNKDNIDLQETNNSSSIVSPTNENTHSSSTKQIAKVSYEVEGDYLDDGQLFATIEGQKYKVDLDEDIACINIIEEFDFDNNGYTDVLLEHNTCGASALSQFMFVSYTGGGFFQTTKSFGHSWSKPTIEKWNNQTSVLVEVNNAGWNNDAKQTTLERYILKDGKAELVESMKKSGLYTIKEISATEFSSDNPDEVKLMVFDLDNNGIQDTIYCTFWERWGSVNWEIHFDGGTISDGTGCDRIGILNTKTNGINDIVCGADIILKWNGEEYE